jgi:hypothetical protein
VSPSFALLTLCCCIHAPGFEYSDAGGSGYGAGFGTDNNNSNNNNNNTAGGNFDSGGNGGFMSPGQDMAASQQTPDNKKVGARTLVRVCQLSLMFYYFAQGSREKQALLPVTIKQLVDATQDQPDDAFLIDGVELAQV